jgi:hypothetical protein
MRARLIAISVLAVLAGCSPRADTDPTSPRAGAAAADARCFSLDENAGGCTETVNNIANVTIVSKDDNAYRAEYRAGFVQGRLQATVIVAARDNAWDSAYLLDPDHAFPRQLGPTEAELAFAAGLLQDNYAHVLRYVGHTADADVGGRLARLLFRLLGIYHGATLAAPADLDFSGDRVPDLTTFQPEELALGYETPSLTFMDVYFLNASQDLWDVIAFRPGGAGVASKPAKCSAFLKRVGDEIILAHNSWASFLSQTMALNLFVNDDFMTVNAYSPGLLASLTDFGYNNKGVMFTETTHRMSHTVARVDALWMFLRAALAEQFSASVDDFFRYVSLENSGTYLNGYMVVDVKNNETGLVEMSHESFVFYRSTGGPYTVTTKPRGRSTAYDAEMVTPEYLMGINYPASEQIRKDLRSDDNRPARRRQFRELLPEVKDVEGAKSVITYTDPANPLSIFGRWDLGRGETPHPRTLPDGSIDAKVATATMARSVLGLQGVLDPRSPATGFWMLYGTPRVDGAPFIWGRSPWSAQKLREVPDVVDGAFTHLDLKLR